MQVPVSTSGREGHSEQIPKFVTQMNVYDVYNVSKRGNQEMEMEPTIVQLVAMSLSFR